LNSSKNKSQSDLNEILFSRYSINYNVTPEVYRKGTLHFKVRANLISLKNLFLKFYLKFKNKDADGTIIEKHIDISKNWDELNRC
jgi:tRNA(His) 5'-end guanylyltransferase